MRVEYDLIVDIVIKYNKIGFSSILCTVDYVLLGTRRQYIVVLCTGRGLKPLQGKSHVLSLETAELLYDSSSTMDDGKM
jgi:hypothetical protein